MEQRQVPIYDRKILGVLMRAAREKNHRTPKEVALRLGVSAGRVRQYEAGAREISLPELETLALYLKIPLSYFLNPDSSAEEDLPAPPQPEKIKTLRKQIGEKLKQARLAAGKERAECAQAVKIKPSALARYERGLSDIPISELDHLANYLGVNFFYFLPTDETGSSDVLDLEKLARLPKEARAFVLNTDNLPYIRMAQKFRDLPHDKLQELGELMLIAR